MPRFRKNIHIGDEEMNFLFTQLNYPDGIGYFVTVADKNKNIYALDLKRSARNEWRIVKKESLPTWLIDMEPVLANSINEARVSNYTYTNKDLVTH
jgi:hypothetical protein